MQKLNEGEMILAEFVCRVCHKKIKRENPQAIDCAWRGIDNEYCPDIMEALHEEQKAKNPICFDCDVDKAEELQRYRATGLDPEQVKDMSENAETRLLTWFEAEYGFSVGELMYILEAKRNGHLVVLPCPMGMELWRVVHVPRKKHCTERYYVRQIKMDKTNALRIALEKEYGRTVFPSRTEARKAAAEMNGNRKKGEENED